MFLFLCLNRPLIGEIPASLQKVSAMPKQNQQTIEVNNKNLNLVHNLRPLKLIDTGVRLPAENNARDFFGNHFGVSKAYADEFHHNSKFLTNTNGQPSMKASESSILKPRVPIRPQVLVRHNSQDTSDHSPTENNIVDDIFKCFAPTAAYADELHNSKSTSDTKSEHSTPFSKRGEEEYALFGQGRPKHPYLGEYSEKCKDQSFSEQYPSLCKEVNSLETNFDMWSVFNPTKVSGTALPFRKWFFNNNQQEFTSADDLHNSKSSPNSGENFCPWCPMVTSKEQANSLDSESQEQTESNQEMQNFGEDITMCLGLPYPENLECLQILGQGPVSPRSFEIDQAAYSSNDNLNKPVKDSDAEENFWWLFNPPKAHADELHNSKQTVPKRPRVLPRVLPVERQESETNQEEPPYCIGCGMYLQKEQNKESYSFEPNMVNFIEYSEKCKDQTFSEKYPSLCKEIDILESNFDL